MSNSIINLALLFSAFVLLIIGAIQDFKTREVVDWVWIVIIGMGSIINVIQVFLLILERNDIINFLSVWLGNIIIALLLGLLLTLTGMGGEADRIAFIAIAFITPNQQPLVSITDPKFTLFLSFIPKILGTFFNSYLLGISVPIIIFCYNIIQRKVNKDYYSLTTESLWVKAGLYFIGYPRLTKYIKEELKVKPWHFDFLEDYNEDTGWNLSFRMRLDTPEADLARKNETIKKIESFRKKVIWVQPTLPFIVFIFLGFVLNEIIGNIIFIMMSFMV